MATPGIPPACDRTTEFSVNHSSSLLPETKKDTNSDMPNMQTSALGQTGVQVSPVALGAGPIPELMTEDDPRQQQAVLERARDHGINWIDTAATYGQGRSEQSLGQALQAIDSTEAFHLATKVRLMPEELASRSVRDIVRDSVTSSLGRLGVERITLLQLHNSVTRNPEDLPTSVTPEDVLKPQGIVSAMQEMQEDGLVDYLGLTGIGHPESLRTLVHSGKFNTIQVPFNLLNPTAAYPVCRDTTDQDYGLIMTDCQAKGMGVFAIRVYAGGAVLGRPPARHTYTTPFFPLDQYQQDCQQAQQLAGQLSADSRNRHSLQETAVRFVLSHPATSSAIVGFSETEHVDQAVAAARLGPLATDDIQSLLQN